MGAIKKHPSHPVAKRSHRRTAIKGAKPFDDLSVDPLAAIINPVPKLRFPERVPLTEPGGAGSTDLYAIGRINDLWAGIVVEAERDGENLGPSLLGGFYTHAPGIFNRINTAVLEALPPFEPPTG